MLPLSLLVLVATSGLIPIDEESLPTVIQEHRGQVVLVNFWATWCIPCREEFPDLVRLHQERHQDGLTIISISIDTPENEVRAGAFLEEHNVPFPTYITHTDELSKFLRVMDSTWTGAIPATFIFNAQGGRAYSHVGRLSYAEMTAQLDGILK